MCIKHSAIIAPERMEVKKKGEAMHHFKLKFCKSLSPSPYFGRSDTSGLMVAGVLVMEAHGWYLSSDFHPVSCGPCPRKQWSRLSGYLHMALLSSHHPAQINISPPPSSWFPLQFTQHISEAANVAGAYYFPLPIQVFIVLRKTWKRGHRGDFCPTRSVVKIDAWAD